MRVAAAALVLLAACAPEQDDQLRPAEADPPASEAPVAPAAAGGNTAADAPHLYMALQDDAAGPTSVVLAIDASRDGTPSDDPAIRITPDGGKCNVQQLRYYNFPEERAQRPIYGPEEAARNVTARELPDYMAQAVTSEMMTVGLIGEPEESQPHNVCTRKLLQRMILDRSTRS